MARASAGDTVAPAGVQPMYIRRPDAEIARDAATSPRTTDAQISKPKV